MALEDIKTPEIYIDLYGKNYQIELNFEAMAVIESKLNKSIFKIKDDFLNDTLKLTEAIIMLHSLLLVHNKHFEIEDLQKNDIGFYVQKNTHNILKAILYPLISPDSFQKIYSEDKKPKKKNL